MFAYARCPKCAGDLPVDALYRAVPSLSLPFRTGLECPSCRARLRPHGMLYYAAMAAVFAVVLPALVLYRNWVGESDAGMTVGVLTFTAAIFTASMLLRRRLTRFTPARDGQYLEFPLGTSS